MTTQSAAGKTPPPQLIPVLEALNAGDFAVCTRGRRGRVARSRGSRAFSRLCRARGAAPWGAWQSDRPSARAACPESCGRCHAQQFGQGARQDRGARRGAWQSRRADRPPRLPGSRATYARNRVIMPVPWRLIAAFSHRSPTIRQALNNLGQCAGRVGRIRRSDRMHSNTRSRTFADRSRALSQSRQRAPARRTAASHASRSCAMPSRWRRTTGSR